jgi:hypothetical protein
LPADQSDVEVAYAQGIGFDEGATRFDRITHQRRKDFIGANGIVNPRAQQTPRFRIHRRIPQLLKATNYFLVLASK